MRLRRLRLPLQPPGAPQPRPAPRSRRAHAAPGPQDDPNETRNLAAARPDVVANLSARLAALRVLRDDGSAPPFEFVYGEPLLASLQQVSSVHSPGGEGAGWTDLSDAVGWLEGLPAGRYTLAARAGDSEGEPIEFVVSVEEEGSLELSAGGS